MKVVADPVVLCGGTDPGRCAGQISGGPTTVVVVVEGSVGEVVVVGDVK